MVTAVRNKQKTSSKSSGGIKKTFSSSNNRILIGADGTNMSAADKKRNKLGYHRTGVACGHCRRRKIRCIPSPDANTTRCQNCIRLKKECQFFPVEQSVPSTTKRPRSESKPDILAGGSEASISSSSPRMHTGTTVLDQFDHFRAQMTPPMPHNQTPYPPATTNSSGILGQQGHEYDYQHTLVHPPWEQQSSINQSPRYGNDRQLDMPSRGVWMSQDQSHNNPFAPTEYSITPVIPASTVQSQDHLYTYSAPTLPNPNYQYSSQSGRDTHPIHTNHATQQYSMYRSNTMPTLDRNVTSRGSTGGGSSMPSQQLMTAPIHGLPQPPHYQHTPEMAANWSGQGQLQSNYIQAGTSPAWYTTPSSMAQSRPGDDNSAQIMLAQRASVGKYRPKPG